MKKINFRKIGVAIIAILTAMLVTVAIFPDKVEAALLEGRTTLRGYLLVADDAFIHFGSSKDVSVEWDTATTPDQLTILPLADDTVIKFGNGTLNADIWFYGNTASDYVLWDASNSILSTVGAATISLAGGITLGDAATDAITATGYFTQVRVGTGSTPDVTFGVDDVFIEDTLEVDGAARFDGTVALGDAAADTITVTGALTVSNNSTIGSSNADTTTVNAQVVSGFRYYNATADIEDCTATTGFSQTTGTGWTIGLGTNNGRDGAAEVLNVIVDTTVGDVMTYDYGSALDLSSYDYVGFWAYPTDAVGATELTITFADSAGTALTGCAATALPALTAATWTWVQYDVSACTRTAFQKILLTAAAAIAAETIDFHGITAYKVSNGYGPANGVLVKMPVSAGTVTQGEFVKWDAIGTVPIQVGVRTATANAYNVAGVACTTSTTEVVVQTTGFVVRPAAGAITDNAAVMVQSGGINVDDGGAASDGIGYATEAVTVTGEHTLIQLRLQ